jgi:RimJ/RimL family protein N-acetyltransferase
MSDGHAALRIETPRLQLRPLQQDAASAIAGDRALAAALIGATLPLAWPDAELLDFLARNAPLPPFGVWLMVETASGTVVGSAGFFGAPDADGEVELGFGVIPDRRGRGYARQAATALVDWALAQPGVSAVRARCETGNGASIRVLTRAGFERTGESDGMLTWRRSVATGGVASIAADA